MSNLYRVIGKIAHDRVMLANRSWFELRPGYGVIPYNTNPQPTHGGIDVNRPPRPGMTFGYLQGRPVWIQRSDLGRFIPQRSPRFNQVTPQDVWT